MDQPALKALFTIVSHGRPDFKNPSEMSQEIREFITIATKFEPDERPTAEEMLKVRQFSLAHLQHPFLSQSSEETFLTLVEKTQKEAQKPTEDLTQEYWY